jgi:hypothetical protein
MLEVTAQSARELGGVSAAALPHHTPHASAAELPK